MLLRRVPSSHAQSKSLDYIHLCDVVRRFQSNCPFESLSTIALHREYSIMGLKAFVIDLWSLTIRLIE